jgi:hypothetical protein
MEKSSVSNGLSFLSLGIAVGALLVSILTPGAQGASGPAGSNGQNGSQGSSGLPGSNGETPYIGNNGNWWIDGVDTGVPANDFNQPDRDIPEIVFAEREEETILFEETLFEPFETDEFRLTYANDLIDEESFIGIDTPAELMSITNKEGKYVLTGDIDFTGYSNWSPINFTDGVDDDLFFSGVFDGAGFSIYGLSDDNLDVTEVYYSYGLFEGLDGATIRHLNFVGNSLDIPIIVGRNQEFGGILAGKVFDSTLYNINSGLSFVGGTSYLGGLAGVFEDSQASFINVGFTTVEGVGYLGGIFGTVWNSTISHVEANTTISATESHIGGIAGSSEQSVYLSIESIFTVTASDEADADYQVEIGGVIGKSYYDRLISVITYGSLDFQPPTDNYVLRNVGGVIGYGFNLTLVNVENYIDILINLGNEFSISEIKSIGGVVGGVEFATLINIVNFESVVIAVDVEAFDEDIFINGEDYPIEYLGGVVGYAYSSLNLYRVANFGTVFGIAEVGGILGSSGSIGYYFEQTIVANEIANFGVVEGYALVGGFTGLNDGRTNLILANFMNYGNLYGMEYVGGLIGIVTPMFGIKVQIINSYNLGSIFVSDYAGGGLVGGLIPEDFYFDFPFFGDLSIYDSFNLGSLNFESLGKANSTYDDVGGGAIIGVRVLLALMDGVSFVEQRSDIAQYTFDDASQTYISLGFSINMDLPAVGTGNLVDILMIEDDSKLLSDENFIYQSDWNFETVWKRSADSNIGLGELPYLRFLDDVSDRRP